MTKENKNIFSTGEKTSVQTCSKIYQIYKTENILFNCIFVKLYHINNSEQKHWQTNLKLQNKVNKMYND